MTDDAPRSHRAPEHRRRTDVLNHRWPTAVGVAVAALADFDMADGTELAAPTVLMPLA